MIVLGTVKILSYIQSLDRISMRAPCIATLVYLAISISARTVTNVKHLPLRAFQVPRMSLGSDFVDSTASQLFLLVLLALLALRSTFLILCLSPAAAAAAAAPSLCSCSRKGAAPPLAFGQPPPRGRPASCLRPAASDPPRRCHLVSGGDFCSYSCSCFCSFFVSVLS